MNLKKMLPEELELMSYNDLTLEILKENNKPLNTPTIFKRICELLDYSDDDYANKIGDYYTALTTDKRFILLDTNEWDIRDNHSVDLMVDEEEPEEEIVLDEEAEEDDYSDGDEVDSIDEVIDEELDDDAIDLSIVEEDELEDD